MIRQDTAESPGVRGGGPGRPWLAAAQGRALFSRPPGEGGLTPLGRRQYCVPE
jgi:hypothetical protein